MTEPGRTLAVLVDGDLCGVLVAGPGLTYDFAYSELWRTARRPPLSISLPNDGSGVPQEGARAFFGGLLPEGGARRQIAEREGIDELDDLALLDLLGRECAGAVTITPMQPDGTFDRHRGARSTQWLDPEGVRQLVSSLRVPGIADPIERYSVSLAGAQLKRGVVVDADSERIGVPIGDEVSTHILKLEPSNYPGMSAVEHCMQHLAADVGLRASTTTLQRVGDEPVLLVERYDRSRTDTSSTLERLHQEDLCQALGRLSSQKYERYEQGVARGPSIADIIALLREHATPSVQHVDDFLRLAWFNLIIGNVDAHAKNYSLLYDRDMSRFQIAPLYDAICVTVFHDHEPHHTRVAEEPLAMNIGGCTRFWQLTRRDIEAFARSIGITPSFVLRQVAKLTATIDAAVDGRIARHVEAAHADIAILERTRLELHDRCAFMRSIVG